MYQPPHFREDRLGVQHGLIRAHPLGLLVTNGTEGLLADPVPFVLDPSDAPFGTLKAHLARANTQWRSFDPDQEVLAVFQGPQTYITPAWYAAKQENGKVVPTWNYAIVQAYGRMVIRDDPVWLRRQIDELTDAQESALVRETVLPGPWSVQDAPKAFVAAQLKGIVGIEIRISRIEAKWKVSQNKSDADRSGVSEGLRGRPCDEARRMSALVAARGPVETE